MDPQNDPSVETPSIDEVIIEENDVNPSSADPSNAEIPQEGVKQEDPSPEVEDVNKEPETLFEAVSKAAGTKKDEGSQEASSSSKTEEGEEKTAGDLKQGDENQTDEEKELDGLDGKPVPYVRFKEVLTEKNEFKSKFEGLSQEVNTLRPQAEAFTNFQGYMQERNVTGPDAVRALDIVGNINTNPEKAFEELGVIYEDLGVALGKILPKDVQQKVDAGEMSEETGKEFAAHRANARTSQQTIDDTQVQQRQSDNQAHADMQNQIKVSVNAWDAEKRQKDPTYDGSKRKLVQTYITAHVARSGAPVNAEQYIQIAESAYNQASETLRSAAPKRLAKTPSPATTGTPSQSVAAPKTMQDAIKLGLS